MANFQPTGQILIGRVPFDNSYKHTMTFSDATAQLDFFNTCCSQHLAEGTYTYIRNNSAVRVPFNAEALYTYNYVMYQNNNYGSKWFYAFIVGCNYVNENTTELLLELDVMQTWYFDYNLRQGFVEREHVSDDTIGAHLNPEPEMPFNLVTKYEVTEDFSTDMKIVVQSNAVPHFKNVLPPFGDTYPQGSDPIAGGVFAGVASGCAYFVFDSDTIGDEYGFQGYLNYMNRAGAAESITNVFMIPSKFVEGTVSGDWNQLSPTYDTGKFREYKQALRPTSLDNGYVPRNNKLFTYPYCFCRIMDNQGASADLRYELWNANNGEYQLTMRCGFEADAQCFIYPNDYMGRAANIASGINFPVTVKSSWTYSSYQTWSAQNSLSNAISVGLNIASLYPAARGVSTAAKALSVAAVAKGNKGGSIGALMNPKTREALKDEVLGKVGKGGLLASAAGAYGLSQFAGEVSRQSKIPDVQKGMASGNSIYASGLMWWSIQSVVIQEEFARIVDNFFDMYGYQVDRVKVPNRTGRQSWNYVKMTNACHWGNVPADDMAQINDIYNAGITFWHTSDVGNYTLPNGIVG